MSFLFLPGTLIHELSHVLMAVLLQVPVGNMQLIPKLVGQDIKLGSVEIAKTDPIRRVLIGMGPFLFGSALLVGVFFYASKTHLFANQLFIVAISYFVFEIGNTMFSSKKDMEGALELLIVFVVFAALFYIVGFRLSALNPNIMLSNILVQQTFKKADIYLVAPVGIDLVLIILLRLSNPN